MATFQPGRVNKLMNEWIKPLYAGLVVAALALAGCGDTAQSDGAEDSKDDPDKGWLDALRAETMSAIHSVCGNPGAQRSTASITKCTHLEVQCMCGHSSNTA